MSACNKFTDLITGKEHPFSDEKVNALKAKHVADGFKRVMFYKKYCVLGQIKHYNDYLIAKGLKKAPVAKKAPAKAKKAPAKATGTPKKAKAQKSPPKKVNVSKCVREGCTGGKICNAKSGRCVKNVPKGASVVAVGGEDFIVTTTSQRKKVEDFKGKKGSSVKKSPAKKVSVSSKKSSDKKSSGKKSPPKKVKVSKCVREGCTGGKICNAKSGRCVKNVPKGASVVAVGREEFIVTTTSQRKKVEEFKGKKGSSVKRSPAKKVSVSSKKSSDKKSSGKKSPPKKVKVTKCVREGCTGGKICNAKSGRCVKNVPKGASVVAVAGEEFIVTTTSQRKKVEDFKGKKGSSVKRSPAKKVSVSKKSPGKKSSGKKSPPKKVKVSKCVREGCTGGKICNAKSGRCVKNVPKGASVVAVAGEEFIVTTTSQRKKVEEFKGKKGSSVKQSIRTPSRKSSGFRSARTPTSRRSSAKSSPAKSSSRRPSSARSGSELVGEYSSSSSRSSALIERLRQVSDDRDEMSSEDSEDNALLSRDDLANINAQKKTIMEILKKCPQ